MLRPPARTFVIVICAATLAAAGALGSVLSARAGVARGAPGAPVTADAKQLAKRVRFVMDYRGSLSATERSSEPVDLRSCSGHDESGALTSSIRPGSRRFTVVLEKVFGRLEADWVGVGSYVTPDYGVGTSSRSAQGWLMVTSGGCRRRDNTYPNCGARTFQAQVRMSAVGSTAPPDVRHRRAYLSWQLEPAGADVGCGIVSHLSPPGKELGEDAAAQLDVRKLYQCGIRKPRRCRMTIRGSSNYPYHATYKTVYGATVTIDAVRRLDWSATFRAVGTR